MFQELRETIKSAASFAWVNRFKRSDLRHFDWPLLLIVLLISLFGVVCIFSATSSEVTSYPETIMDMLETQSITYPRLQFLWILAGLVAMTALFLFPYEAYGMMANVIYWLNVIMLAGTLVLAEAGRGGMTAFIGWGQDRGLQTSEFGKVFMIICLAKLFANLYHPIRTFREIIPYALYVALPLILIILQPDFGTAMVYVAVFCLLIFISGTNAKMIWTVLGVAVILALTYWFYLQNTSSESFRATRILIWLDPNGHPDDARQVLNAQIAVGSGGLFGKGIVSPGSFASLGYISDDHTDFIFAVVCESFGLVGGGTLILGYALLIARLVVLAIRVRKTDKYGMYLIFGVMGMFLFHIVENICMVIGLTPVTGIPLPFVSYGGSNMLTNMMAIGLVQNVVMRTARSEQTKKTVLRTVSI